MKELAVLRRSVVVNQLYGGSKLAVEAVWNNYIIITKFWWCPSCLSLSLSLKPYTWAMSTAAILSAILLFASPAFAQEFVPTPVKRAVTETTTPLAATTTPPAAANSPLPLTDYHYTYPNVPEQVKFVFLPPTFFLLLMAQQSFRCWPWPSIRLQHLQQYHWGARFTVSDHVYQWHWW
jgi:hypothetical protein